MYKSTNKNVHPIVSFTRTTWLEDFPRTKYKRQNFITALNTIKNTNRKKKSSLSKVRCLSRDTQEQKYMKLQLKGFLMNTIKVTRRN